MFEEKSGPASVSPDLSVPSNSLVPQSVRGPGHHTAPSQSEQAYTQLGAWYKKKINEWNFPLSMGGGKIGSFSTQYLFFYLASKWSETSRNAKKIFSIL